MSNMFGTTIDQVYKKEICANCLYTRGCKRGLYPEHNEDTKTTTLKCGNYVRRPTDEELRQIYSGEDY
jgi:hypothetical protein